MAGTTSRLALPYPTGTDIGGQGDTVIKNLAEALDTKLDIHTMPDGIGRRVRNLATYSESVSNGTGYIIINTNIPINSSVMTMLRLTGMMYEGDNGLVDVGFTFYPYSADSSVLVPEVTNMGSFHFGSVQFLNRTSTNTVAIAMTPGLPAAYFNYPKLAVDGVFGHNIMTDAQLKTGWSITRVTSLTGYTVKATPLSPRPSSEDTGWIPFSFTNGWSQYAPGNGWDAQYRRKGGIVYLRGLVVAGTPNAYMHTLPAGFRPKSNTLRGAMDAGSVMNHLYVDPAGGINCATTPHPAWLSVEGINFPADQ